jgi:hypothetical protein
MFRVSPGESIHVRSEVPHAMASEAGQRELVRIQRRFVKGGSFAVTPPAADAGDSRSPDASPLPVARVVKRRR